ncbi:MAG: 16S rRNA (adenine(1518)-N(6)/adenine(1519)-N(6))-dimethyltransferase RsmA [Actinomycetota bacterium]|nr:16S rRNA (adenine(1518)-N(6)/adenine(1519)-N(6))-dimethyltransferase RsmA [Actinomycetota bacterium]
MTHSPADIRRLLEAHQRHPRRDLGQNFVADPNTVRRIARIAGVGDGDRVVEIGAGLGSLTLALAETGASIMAVEIDGYLTQALRHVVAEWTNVTVVEADAMTIPWEELLGGDPWTIVANLPYNVATPLVCDLLDDVPQVRRLVVMVQREVGERFVATPRSAAYGAVSVKIAYWASARIVGHVPAAVFFPRPNVESTLVEIVRRQPTDPGIDRSVLFTLVRQAFGQRRKMLRRSLAGSLSAEQFAAAGVAPESRPEELDVTAWCRLTAEVTAR